MGVVSLSNYGTSSIIATNVAICTLDCVVAALGSYFDGGQAFASVGFASGSYNSQQSIVVAEGVVLYASGSNITATGYDSVASMGLTLSYGFASSINAQNTSVYATKCSIAARTHALRYPSPEKEEISRLGGQAITTSHCVAHNGVHNALRGGSTQTGHPPLMIDYYMVLK